MKLKPWQILGSAIILITIHAPWERQWESNVNSSVSDADESFGVAFKEWYSRRPGKKIEPLNTDPAQYQSGVPGKWIEPAHRGSFSTEITP